jgi:heavy metal efflux system protein
MLQNVQPYICYPLIHMNTGVLIVLLQQGNLSTISKKHQFISATRIFHMLNRIIGFSIRNKLIIGILILGLVGWGAYNVTKLPIDAVPDITNNQVLVITSSPSLGAADMERLITFPLEQATRNIPGIIEQRSFSRPGLSIITIVFNDATDVYWARQQISERLIQAQEQIPAGLGIPALGPVTTGLGEIFQYVVKPKKSYEGKYSVTELRTIQDWIVRRQLLGTPGVADVSSFGGKLRQMEISVDATKLKSYGVTITDIFSALQRNNQNTGGAYIEKGPTVLFIRSEGLVKTPEEIGDIMLKTLPDGTPLFIRHVAAVQEGFATRYGAMTYNDEGEVAGAVVMMLKGENSSHVIKEVKKKIAQIQTTLPEGVVIEAFLDRTKMVNNAIHTVEKNLAEGALIVVFILVLFLGNLRAGLIVASVIPLSMLFAISMMNVFGISGNLMSLGALDFGLIVDGAVIIVEAVMHRLHQNKAFRQLGRINQKQMDEEVHHSASKMMNAAVFGQIIILIVYLPILTLQGIEGKMFKPMAQTVALAITGAFLLSLTYVPMMTALLLSKKTIHKRNFSDRMMIFLERIYRRFLERALSIPKIIVGTTVALFVLALYILFSLGGEFIPKLEEGDFAVDTRVLTGSSLNTTINATQQTAHILLQQFPEVEKVVTKIGSGEIPTDPMPMEASDMMVILKPKKEWTSATSFDELANKMSTALEDVPGVTAGFQYPVQMRFNELMTGGRQDVVCKIFGEDLDTLTRYASKLGSIIGSVEGARDIYVESQTGLPQIVVNYNRVALSQYGLTVEDVNRVLNSAFAGAVSGQLFENERRFDIVVRLNSEGRKELSDVQSLLIATPAGQQIPLQQVADVAIQVGPHQIQRENAQRRITVGFNVRGRDVQSIVNELQQKAEKQILFPAGYYVTYGGQFENLMAAKKRLSIAVPAALLLIFLMLYFTFNSIKQGLLIFTAIPLSVIGGVITLWARDMPFSISAGVGFIALFGVAVLNGIVMITEFNVLKKNGLENIKARIITGASNRLRPVLMTAAVASLGFLPMALSNGAGAEVQRPLATVVIGGLATATFLTLFVLPILYRWFEELNHKPVKKRPVVETLILIAVLLPGLTTYAQEPRISLQTAIDSAWQHNAVMRTNRLQTLAQKQLEKAAVDIPFTSLQTEYGQINSYQNDTRFTLSQSIAFPAVYKQQKALLVAQTRSSFLNEQLSRQEVKKEVTRIYYQMLMLLHKRSLLQEADSIFTAFLQRQELRFRAGDANILEKTAAETLKKGAANQLQVLDADLAILQTQFGYWLNTVNQYLPEVTALKLTAPLLIDTALLDQIPYLKWKEQQSDIAMNEWKLSKAKNLPLLQLGYSNQSIRGFQNVDGIEKYFTGTHRFSALNAGVHIPVFNLAGRTRVKAGKLNYKAALSGYEQTKQEQSTRLKGLWLSLKKQERSLTYYESTLQQADTLFTHAQLQYESGSINYLEWMMLINQSISIRSGYLEAVDEWNRIVIEINAYSPEFLR